MLHHARHLANPLLFLSNVLRSSYKCEHASTGSVVGMPRANYDEPPLQLAKLGQAVRALRERQGLKQIELATAAEMTESQVSDIERGKNNPGWLLLMRLVVDGLGLKLHDLAAAYEEASR